MNVPESARRSGSAASGGALNPVVVTTTGFGARGCDSHGVHGSPAGAATRVAGVFTSRFRGNAAILERP
jgi:hypothetical protein